jgi:hypothetical protein
MKRIAILLAVVALFAATATIALADDDVETNADADTSEEAEGNDTHTQNVDRLADFLLAPFYVGDKDTENDKDAAKVQIEGLRTGAVTTGWGAIFKLLQLAKTREMSLTDLLAEIEEDGGGWAFGRRFKGIENPADPTDDAPKNFGQLKKQYRELNGSHGKKPKKP